MLLPLRPLRRRFASIFLLAAFFLAAPFARAATWFVAPSPTGNDANPGTSIGAPFATIQKGIMSAVTSGDVVQVAAGTYTGVGNVNLSFQGVPITVVSASGAAATIVDCQATANTRGLVVQGLETSQYVFDGFTIKNGRASQLGAGLNGLGGGLYILNSSPTIQNCVFDGCQASGIIFSVAGTSGRGGGAYIENGSPTLTNCVFKNCSALGGAGTLSGAGGTGMGGGLHIYNASPTLTNCVVGPGNAALGGSGITSGGGYGGGVYVSNQNPGSQITNVSLCVINQNQAAPGGAGAVGAGGGLFCDANGQINVTDTTISANTATAGGGAGLYYAGTSFTYPAVGSSILERCTISGNSIVTSGNGGGVYVDSPGILQLTNCTVSGNQATAGGSGSGGGIYCVSGLNILNCTIASNTASGTLGGGIARPSGVVTLKNSIVALHGTSKNFGSITAVTSVGGNVHDDLSEVLGQPGDANANPSIFLGALANNGGPTQTHAVAPPSTAIDQLAFASAPSLDQRGILRTGGGATADKGAFEYIAPVNTPSPTPSPSATASPSATRSPSPTASPTRTPTPSFSPTPSETVSDTPTPTETPTPTSTPTPTLSPSPTSTPTLSPTPSISPTPSMSPTPNAASDWEDYE